MTLSPIRLRTGSPYIEALRSDLLGLLQKSVKNLLGDDLVLFILQKRNYPFPSQACGLDRDKPNSPLLCVCVCVSQLRKFTYFIFLATLVGS